MLVPALWVGGVENPYFVFYRGYKILFCWIKYNYFFFVGIYNCIGPDIPNFSWK